METIEHNVQQPRLRTHKTPILFQHGAWHGAWCWQQWMDYFARLGYEVHAISLPAHGKSSANKKHINLYTLKDYVNALASQVEAMDPKPIIVAHSMGGGILQKYLETHQLPAAVLLASIPSMGIFPMALRFLRRHPVPTLKVLLKLNAYEWINTPGLAQNLFLDPKTEIDIVVFQKQLVRETLNVFGLMVPFAKINPVRSPILVIAAEKDVVFTVAEEERTARKYDAQNIIISGQAHNLMMETAWKEVADIIDHWITCELELP